MIERETELIELSISNAAAECLAEELEHLGRFVVNRTLDERT